ncbi:MAG: phage tail sheath subtilisin-like domain-containing protein, partial [Myxococcota bacterium]
MSARLHPGVYVEEVPGGARAIEGAGTSTTILVGDTERGPVAPTKIKGIADFERVYGGYLRHDGTGESPVLLRYAMDGFFGNGGTTAYILRAHRTTDNMVVGTRVDGSNLVTLEASSPGAWSTRVEVRFLAGPTPERFHIEVSYRAPGTASATLVETWNRLSLDPEDENYAPDVLRRSLYVRWRAGSVVPQAEANPVGMTGGTGDATKMVASDFTSGVFDRLDEVTDASLLVCPAYPGSAVSQQQAALSYAEARPRRDLFCIADMPDQGGTPSVTQATVDTVSAFGSLSPKTDMGAVYFPWVEVPDPIGSGRDPVMMVPPSAYIAGLYARIDQRRGVWKAPAGLEASLLGVNRIAYKLLDTHQDELNPLGINALRPMPQGGNVVWGARTMVPSGQWRYIPVRRMAIFLRTSIYNGIQWAVFEPNGLDLWANLRLTIEGFMDQLFRQGAFAGATSREA